MSVPQTDQSVDARPPRHLLWFATNHRNYTPPYHMGRGFSWNLCVMNRALTTGGPSSFCGTIDLSVRHGLKERARLHVRCLLRPARFSTIRESNFDLPGSAVGPKLRPHCLNAASASHQLAVLGATCERFFVPRMPFRIRTQHSRRSDRTGTDYARRLSILDPTGEISIMP